jgi:hypothetical protein
VTCCNAWLTDAADGRVIDEVTHVLEQVLSDKIRYVDEIIFPESWQRAQDEWLERYQSEQRARRLADLRHRLLTPLPSFLAKPGTLPPLWEEKDPAILQDHVDNLAALLKLSKMAREDCPNALALRTALILNAPLLDAGPGALGTLSLHPSLFVGVVAAFDCQHANTTPKESP